MRVRPYRPEEAGILADLYRDSVRGLGSAAYGPAQVDVWAAWPDDARGFREGLARGLTLVAEEPGAGAIAAFGQLDPADHIRLLYTCPAFARRGAATAVYRGLEEAARQRGIGRLTTDASRVSRPFFEAMGFGVEAPELVGREGVTFERFRMVKILVGTDQP